MMVHIGDDVPRETARTRPPVRLRWPSNLPSQPFFQRKHVRFECLDDLPCLVLSSLEVDYFGFPTTQESSRGTVFFEQPGIG